MQKINYLRKEKVLTIALILALFSALWVHPDREYAGYVDMRVLALLFCLMLLVKGFQNIGLLDRLTLTVFGGVKDSRRMGQILMLLCFFVSMIVTNDVGLITFVPFALLALKKCGQEKLMIEVVVLQTLAANLGSMFTPIGNHQNLYLFSVSGMDAGTFFKTMFPVTFLSFILLMAATLHLPKEEINLNMENSTEDNRPMPKKELIVYSLLFIMNLLVVFHVLDWKIALAVTVAVILMLRKQELFKQVDYALLMTFVEFFIFVGNMGRIPAIGKAVQSLLSGREILVSALFSQILSNVPAALLLSGFTDNFRGLLLGTNIGGLGTLIASMASLISYKLYAAEPGAKKGKYMLVFTLYNVEGLMILLAAVLLKEG